MADIYYPVLNGVQKKMKDMGDSFADAVAIALPNTIFGITVPISAANTPQTLMAKALINGVVIKALPTNVGNVLVSGVGDTASGGYPLTPGEAISFAVTDLSAIQIYGANVGDAVAITGN